MKLLELQALSYNIMWSAGPYFCSLLEMCLHLDDFLLIELQFFLNCNCSTLKKGKCIVPWYLLHSNSHWRMAICNLEIVLDSIARALFNSTKDASVNKQLNINWDLNGTHCLIWEPFCPKSSLVVTGNCLFLRTAYIKNSVFTSIMR